MANVTETRVANKYFSVRITVEGMPAGSTLRQHLDAARGNVMRFFDQGLPFRIKVQCTWTVADRDGEPVDFPMHLTSRAMDVLNGAQSIGSWQELVDWLIRQQDTKQEVAESYDRVFSGVTRVVIHIPPGSRCWLRPRRSTWPTWSRRSRSWTRQTSRWGFTATM